MNRPEHPAQAATASRQPWAGAVGWIMTLIIAACAIWVVRWSGISLNVVSTDSMLPDLRPTDMVISVGPDIRRPEIGTITIFTAEFAGQHIPAHVHRIVGVEPNGEWITKGDNTKQPDPWRVKPADVKGVVVGSVPTALVRNPYLLSGFLFVFLAVLFWPKKREVEDESGSRSGG